MQVLAYDFETTGPVPRQCEPLQLGAALVKINEDGSFTLGKTWDEILTIEADEVPAGAFRVHGISKEATLKGKCPKTTVSALLNGDIVLGYNNRSFDDVIARRYGAEIIGSIDLFVATRRMKTEGALEKASLTAAYEALTGKKAVGAHDALSDVKMTLELIKPCMEFFKCETFEEFIEFLSTSTATTDMKMPFGKHKGVKLKDLPKSYVQWSKKNMDLDGDLKAGFDLL